MSRFRSLRREEGGGRGGKEEEEEEEEEEEGKGDLQKYKKKLTSQLSWGLGWLNSVR